MKNEKFYEEIDDTIHQLSREPASVSDDIDISGKDDTFDDFTGSQTLEDYENLELEDSLGFDWEEESEAEEDSMFCNTEEGSTPEDEGFDIDDFYGDE